MDTTPQTDDAVSALSAESQELLRQAHAAAMGYGAAPDPDTQQWPLVKMPFYGDLELARGTRYTAGMFVKGSKLFVGIEHKGAFGFRIGQEVHPHYVDEKLHLNSLVDACGMANFVNSQMQLFRFAYTPEIVIDQVRATLSNGDTPHEQAARLALDVSAAKVRYEMQVREQGLDLANPMDLVDAVQRFEAFNNSRSDK